MTVGLFTATGAGGVAIATTQSAASVTTASENTNANMMGLTLNNAATQSYRLADVPTLYFRVVNPHGSARTGKFLVSIIPLS